jgi:hypothetical protein
MLASLFQSTSWRSELIAFGVELLLCFMTGFHAAQGVQSP